MGGATARLDLIELDTGATRSVAIRPFGMAVGLDVADDGRFAAVIEHASPDGKPAITTTVVSADRKTLTRFAGGTGTVKLVPGEALVAGTGRQGPRKARPADPKSSSRSTARSSRCVRSEPARTPRSRVRRARQGHLDGNIAARVRST